MLRSTEGIVVILAILVGAVGAIFFLRSAYYFVKMMGEQKSGSKRLIGDLLGTLAFAFPQFWTAQGNVYRVEFVKNLWLSIFCFGTIAVVSILFDVPQVASNAP